MIAAREVPGSTRHTAPRIAESQDGFRGTNCQQ